MFPLPNATALIEALLPLSTPCSRRACTSQRRTVPLAPAEASMLPFRLKATPLTGSTPV